MPLYVLALAACALGFVCLALDCAYVTGEDLVSLVLAWRNNLTVSTDYGRFL
jgi:hypothetical protein